MFLRLFSWSWLRLGAAMLFAAALSGCGYNDFQRLDEQVKSSWAEVLNQYQRRADLVPNLVEVARGYLQHEASTLQAVVAARQIARAVEGAIASLPQEYRQALELREMEGLSYEEIAGLTDVPVGTVRSRIFRAREAIATKVGPLLEHRSGKRW